MHQPADPRPVTPQRYAYALLRLVCVLLAFFSILPTGDVSAQVQRPQRPFAIVVGEWERALDQVSQQIGRPGTTQAELSNQRTAVEQIHSSALKLKDEASLQASSVRRLLETLGPAPGANQPAESEAVAARRRVLVEELAIADGQARQAELIVARSNGLLADITASRRTQLMELLQERGPTPFSPRLWMTASVEFAHAITRIITAPVEWYQSDVNSSRWHDAAPTIIFVVILAALGTWPLRLWLLRNFGRRHEIEQPTYPRRVVASIVEAVARGLLPAFAAIALLAVVLEEDLTSGLFEHVLKVAVISLVKFLVVTGFARAALAPDMPAWRLAPFTNDSAALISGRIVTLAAAMFVYNFLNGVGIRFQISPELFQATALVFNGLVAIAILRLMSGRNWRISPPVAAVSELPEAQVEPSPPSRVWPILRVVVSTVAIVAPLAALIGFSQLPWFLIINLVDTLVLAALLFLMRSLVHEVASVLLFEPTRVSALLRRTLDIDAAIGKRLIFWIEFALDILLWCAGIAFLLVIWGGDGESVMYFVTAAIKGISIGKYTLSVVDVAFAAVLFIALLVATRHLQHVLENRILPHTRLDAGVRHSLKAVVGYVGLVVAVIAAVAAIGIDFSNLALIFGALSVGIGFGLQNIVNNFVSGLILLIERPIKVGDWVVVGNKEGTVRRINVRATEIETFQRAAIIIPNAEILSSAVVNWTYKDRSARVDIKANAAVDSDPEQVIKVLLDCARAHRNVAHWPQPQALLMEFGPNSLQFELRVFIDDVNYFANVPSELRIAVHHAFRAAGIAIPTAQAEIRVADVERLAGAVAKDKPAPERSADPAR